MKLSGPSALTLWLQLALSIVVVGSLLMSGLGVMSLMMGAAGMLYVVLAGVAFSRSAVAVVFAAVITAGLGVLAASAVRRASAVGFDFLTGRPHVPADTPAAVTSPAGEVFVLQGVPAPPASFDWMPYMAVLIAVLALAVTWGHISALAAARRNRRDPGY